jgi:hypothetical protein
MTAARLLELDNLEVDASHHLEGSVDKWAKLPTPLPRRPIAGLFLGQRDEFLHGMGRNARMDDERGRSVTQLGDRDKGFDGS